MVVIISYQERLDIMPKFYKIRTKDIARCSDSIINNKNIFYFREIASNEIKKEKNNFILPEYMLVEKRSIDQEYDDYFLIDVITRTRILLQKDFNNSCGVFLLSDEKNKYSYYVEETKESSEVKRILLEWSGEKGLDHLRKFNEFVLKAHMDYDSRVVDRTKEEKENDILLEELQNSIKSMGKK